MMFSIEYAIGVANDLAALRAFERRQMLDQIEEQLTHQPTQETRNKKLQVDLATDRSGETVVPASPLIALEAKLTKALQLARSGEAKRAMTAVRAARKQLRQVLPPSVPPLPPFEITLV